MALLSVITEQLPVVSAQLGIEQSTLSSFMAGAQPVATPVAAGPHFPGTLCQLGFAIITPAVCSNINAGIGEQALYSNTLVPVGISYDVTDVAGGAAVDAVGG